MLLKRISLERNPDLVRLIENSYMRSRIYGITVHKITIDHNDVNIELHLKIGDGLGIEGTLQVELDDNNNLSEKIRRIIELEDGND